MRIKRYIATGVLVFSIVVSQVTVPAGAESIAENDYTVNTRAENGSELYEKELSNNASDNYVEGEAIITLVKPESDSDPLLDEGKTGDVEVTDVLDFGSAEEVAETPEEKKDFRGDNIFVSVVESDELTTEELIEKYKDRDGVVEVMPNYRVHKSAMPTDDELSDYQWYLGGKKIKHETKAEIKYQEQPEPSGDEVVVAVVDDGMAYDHEDLKDVVWNNPYDRKELPGAHGYDVINDDDDPYPTSEEEQHGTHVAGTIAATTGNQKGIAGVSKNVKIMPLKIFDENKEESGTVKTIVSAYAYIYKAQMLGTKVVAINCSFGNEPTDVNESPELTKYENLVMKKLAMNGALFSISAGNEGTDVTKKNQAYPFTTEREYTVRVGSTTPLGKISTFSNYSKKEVDVMAPGSMILSTVPYDTFLPELYSSEKKEKLCALYEDFNSTSLGFRVYTSDGIGYYSTPSQVSLSKSFLDVFSESNGGSFSMSFNTPKKAYEACAFIDVTDLGIDCKTRDYYYSYHIAPRSQASRGCWSLKVARVTSKEMLEIDGRDYFVLDIPGFYDCKPSELKGGSILIDNFSISVADPDTSEFGKYKFMRGTSMATPVVAGAIARLALLYPDDSINTRKAKLMASVTKMSDLSDKCVSGGIIDISRYEDEDIKGLGYPDELRKVKKIKLNKTKATLKVGKKLKLKATVTPSYAKNKKVKWKVSNKKYASVSSSGVVKAKKKGKKHTVTVTATSAENKSIKAKCKIKIKA